MRLRMSIKTSSMMRVIHVFKAELRRTGTETMKRINGKEVCYSKKAEVCRLKHFRPFWKKSNEKYL